MNTSLHSHDYLSEDSIIKRNETKTLLVVILTSVMMVVEILAGYLTSSMALLADGWHMASHAGALTISFIAYKLARSSTLGHRFSFGAGKFIPLGGYTSAVALGIVAILVAVQSFERLLNPVGIQFDTAVIIAAIGLAVNLVSAFILNDNHEHAKGDDHSDHHSHQDDHHHHDHNLRSAYLHVMADALTSVLALVALIFGKFYGVLWLDAVMGIVGAMVILSWAYQLCKDAGWELLDGHAKSVDQTKLRTMLEDESTKVGDLHIWRIAPKAHACEIVILSRVRKGADFYREKLLSRFAIHHAVIEEREWIDI